ncbi:MAG TPA: double-strand break repair protein AddB, partial [Alphaproteobacteria bacterium]
MAEIRLILPTRRSCRIVRDSFLRQSNGAALILPRMQAAGDVDDSEIDFENAALGDDGTALLAIPPAMPPLRRQVILSRLITARPDYEGTPEHALALARALAELLDRVHTEGRDLRELHHLVDEEFSEHWGITLKFLAIISDVWPGILAAEGCIDAADRRNRLLLAMADHWEKAPPPGRVIAAGSTGSIPAAARLLKVIAGLPQGQVILPGLDQDMDERSWDKIDDTHPQAALKNLLGYFGIDRSDVQPWGQETARTRNVLAREIMRPSATTDQWRALRKNPAPLQQELEGLQQIDCGTAQEEARLISLIFRYVQHTLPKTAALVTFDRQLARRVAAACARWGIAIDDTAGQLLNSTPAGGFLALCAEACIRQLAPVPLLGLLKHRHAAAGLEAGDYRAAVRRLDHRFLRGPRPGPGIAGLALRAPEMQPFIGRLNDIFTPFLALCDDRAHPFKTLLASHIRVAEALAATPGASGADRLWAGEDGEGAARFLNELQDYAEGIPPVRAIDYLPMLRTLMEGVTIRPAWGTHPRLMILGPLESRLVQADVMILGGLNEGSWPPAAEIDPWMSRPMRQKFALPSPERGIG